mmetsp:Transcript_27146/g.59755  ORF Transcript_27146/g.59755 Transcript_27146/m.59755 type:complete len:81 (+) Transcript_27146:226-468(+)
MHPGRVPSSLDGLFFSDCSRRRKSKGETRQDKEKSKIRCCCANRVAKGKIDYQCCDDRLIHRYLRGYGSTRFVQKAYRFV